MFLFSSFDPKVGRINSAAATTAQDSFEYQFLRVLNKVYQTIERNEARLADQDRRESIKIEWQQLALVIDRLVLSFTSFFKNQCRNSKFYFIFIK